MNRFWLSPAELAVFSSSARGRSILLSAVAAMETDAAQLCRKLPGMPVEPQFTKMIAMHSGDEDRHAEILRGIIGPSAIPMQFDSTDRLLAEMAPRNLGEVYVIVQALEEFATATYPTVAEAFRPWDPAVSAAIDAIMVDEVKHLRYCAAVIGHFGCADKLPAARAALDKILGRDGVPWEQIVDFIIESYDQEKHLAMIESWHGKPLDPRALGSGLVIPGVCCGFVDCIGRTGIGYFYGLQANPKVPIRLKARLVLLLGERITAAAKAAGITHGITSTSRGDVGKFWARRGWKPNGESVLQGEL